MTETVSLKEAARRLGVSQETVRRQARSGELRSYQERTANGFRWVIELPTPARRGAKPSPDLYPAGRNGRAAERNGMAARRPAPAPVEHADRAPLPVPAEAQRQSLALLQTMIADCVNDAMARLHRDLRADLAAHPLSQEGLRAAVAESVGAALDGQAQLLTEALDEQRQARAGLDAHEQQTRALLVQEQRQLRVVLGELMRERDARERAAEQETAALRQQVTQLGQQVAVLIMALEQQQRNGDARSRQELATTQEVLGGVRELLDERQHPRGLARFFRRG